MYISFGLFLTLLPTSTQNIVFFLMSVFLLPTLRFAIAIFLMLFFRDFMSIRETYYTFATFSSFTQNYTRSNGLVMGVNEVSFHIQLLFPWFRQILINYSGIVNWLYFGNILECLSYLSKLCYGIFIWHWCQCTFPYSETGWKILFNIRQSFYSFENFWP